ncbi:MAG: class I SAM-dependent methyltransferase [Pseudomonadota bacterium]
MTEITHVQNRACPICGGTACYPLHEMHFSLPADSPLPTTYTIVASTDCGFVYADTPGSSADYARYYSDFSHYEDPAIATGGGEQDFDRERLAQTAAWLAQYVPANARVLDIGCGNGGLLLALRQHGFSHLAGMDPSNACITRIQKLGLLAFHGWLGELPATGMQFDLIVLSHVLEHLLLPREALASLHALLSPSGRIYVETPDAARYVEHPSVSWYYFDSEHINHFDHASLDNLARSSGFHTEYSGSKTLSVQGGHEYPAVFALLSPTAMPAHLRPDDTCRLAVAAYVRQSAQTRTMSAALQQALAQHRPIALWGAGSQAQRLLQEAAMANARIVAVVDGDCNKQGHRFAGCIVSAPATGLQALPADCLVVIAAALVAEQILAEYHALGLSYECIVN